MILSKNSSSSFIKCIFYFTPRISLVVHIILNVHLKVQTTTVVRFDLQATNGIQDTEIYGSLHKIISGLNIGTKENGKETS